MKYFVFCNYVYYQGSVLQTNHLKSVIVHSGFVCIYANYPGKASKLIIKFSFVYEWSTPPFNVEEFVILGSLGGHFIVFSCITPVQPIGKGFIDVLTNLYFNPVHYLPDYFSVNQEKPLVSKQF